MRRFLGGSVLLWIVLNDLLAQNLPVQNIRGAVTEKETGAAVPGVLLLLQGTTTQKHAVSNQQGAFQIEQVPVGHYKLEARAVGYEPFVTDVVLSSAAKEVVLHIALTEKIRQLAAVEVSGSRQATQPLNEMSTVSVRSFSATTLSRYPASLGDPARMATAFAGVNSGGDLTNEIIIRGNPPNGLLWRLEGVEIPSPNHFTNEGASGGGVSILSPQVLGTSDFLTGAFAAEYGNALSGVFDLNLRRGNNTQREFTAQVSGVGVELAAEGPFRRNQTNAAAFLVNYRYSTVDLVRRTGIELPSGVLTFQDLSFNTVFPLKKGGTISIFGIGGLSAQKQIAVRDSARWRNTADRTDRIFSFQMGAIGISHQATVGKRAWWRQTLAFTYGGNNEYEARVGGRYVVQPLRDNDYGEQRLAWAGSFNYKLNARLTAKTGMFINRIAYDLTTRRQNTPGRPLVTQLQEKNSAFLWQAYMQWKYRLSTHLTALAGIHFTRLTFNNRQVIEPRLSVRWQASEQHSFTVAYGRHSRMLPLGTYFAQQQIRNIGTVQPNKQLDFTKSEHWVTAWEWQPNEYWHIKVEGYYQRLFSVPVRTIATSNFSLINQFSGFVSDSLVNKGKGKNYGLELTIERPFANNWFLLNTLSLYDSRYMAADGIWRNTRFNGGHVWNVVVGKDFVKNKTDRRGRNIQRIISLNVRSVWSGGFRYTPIDEVRSLRDNTERRIEAQAFEAQLPDYFRLDIRFALRKNRPHYSRVFAIDLQNATNHQNVARYYYDSNRRAIHTEYWLPILPIPSWRIEF
ncbi:MAG: TonB-dependent receptor [Cytophagales bacterium]|nr:TonB-dependent receptor [Bernardetiaceae bacterium]MDW8206082.1 TonB-dependent receptor [Cytophagales bacterium]